MVLFQLQATLVSQINDQLGSSNNGHSCDNIIAKQDKTTQKTWRSKPRFIIFEWPHTTWKNKTRLKKCWVELI